MEKINLIEFILNGLYGATAHNDGFIYADTDSIYYLRKVSMKAFQEFLDEYGYGNVNKTALIEFGIWKHFRDSKVKVYARIRSDIQDSIEYLACVDEDTACLTVIDRHYSATEIVDMLVRLINKKRE